MRDFVRSFDLTKSGKYKLVVSFSVPDKSKERGFARVTSEEVLLEVVEDNDPRLLKK
jgi:hypothetical protein